MTTIYEIRYLGTYYYSRTKPPETENLYAIGVINGLHSNFNPISKREIANHLEIRSTSLTVIRAKKL
jgi:hypothetical protein